jgi:hypothetical protein
MTNIVLLVGNLGADPELRSTNNGTDIATFSLGTSRPKRDSEGKTYKDESGFTAKDTEWHRVTCFNGLGRIVAQHAGKGMLVSVAAGSTTASGPTARASSATATRSSPTTSSSSAVRARRRLRRAGAGRRGRSALLRAPSGPGGLPPGLFLPGVSSGGVGGGARLEEAQCGGRRSGSQGCAVPPICFANRLPHAPLRGALRRP